MVLLIGKAYRQSAQLICNFSHDNHHHYVHSPSITLNHQKTTSIEELRHVVNKTSLLASVMVEQPIIQEVISSVEIFDDTKIN